MWDKIKIINQMNKTEYNSYLNTRVQIKVKVALVFNQQHAIIHRRMEVYLHELLTSVLDVGGWSATHLSHFMPEKINSLPPVW
jgi:hypothetical protein